MCLRWIPGERNPRNRLPGAVMKRLVIKIVLQSPAHCPLPLHREESECPARLVLFSHLAVPPHRVTPHISTPHLSMCIHLCSFSFFLVYLSNTYLDYSVQMEACLCYDLFLQVGCHIYFLFSCISSCLSSSRTLRCNVLYPGLSFAGYCLFCLFFLESDVSSECLEMDSFSDVRKTVIMRFSK